MLQYVLRVGARRYYPSCYRVLRLLSTSARTFPFDGPEADGVRDVSGRVRCDSIGCVSNLDGVGPTVSEDCTGGSLASVDTRPISALPRLLSVSQKLTQRSPSDFCTYQSVFQPVRRCLDVPALFSTVVDVDSLESYELAASSREDDTAWPWIANEELWGVLTSAMTRPFKRSSNRLLHPATPQELELRLHQALTFTPLPSLAGLTRYHDAYPSLHSAPSYNFLVQLAIRHTSYSKAFQLLRHMEAMGIRPDGYSKQLYVRLLVRTGRWSSAWSFVQHELSSTDEKTALLLLLELIGYCKPIEFHGRPSPSDLPNRSVVRTMPEISPRGVQGVSVQDCQRNVLTVISNHLPLNTPPVHSILAIVRHLLVISRTKTARAVSLEWISRLPKHLSVPRKRHCLRLLHLHLAFSGKTFATHLSNRVFVELFLQKRPDLRPNSTTLFLLLRSLTRVKGRPTFHAVQLVHAFRKKWGVDVIDRRVRRRIASIAVREGRLNVARAWLEADDRASVSRKLMVLERGVVGEQVAKLPQKIRRSSFNKLMPGVHDENRKWRWLKRRFWKLEEAQLSKQTQT